MAVPIQHVELVQCLKALYKSSDYSDFKIICGNDVHNVHKAIVCSQSDFFAAACRFGQEAANGEIHLQEDKPALVKAMIQYLYHLEYDLPDSEDSSEKAGLVFHAKMYSLADKYNIRGMKAFAQDHFRIRAQGNCRAKEFPAAIRIVYKTTVDEDRGLRDVVVDIISMNMDLLDRLDIKVAVRATANLAFELLMKSREQKIEPVRLTGSFGTQGGAGQQGGFRGFGFGNSTLQTA